MWDEPDLLQNVKRVNPWLVELVSDMPAIHPRPSKKLRISQQYPDSPLEGQLPTPIISGKPLGRSSSPLWCFPDSTPAGIQGARHSQFGPSLSVLHLNKLQSGLFHAGFHHLDHTTLLSRRSTGLIIDNPESDNNISCLLTTGNSRNTSQSTEKPCIGQPPQLMLFGKPILTEVQISLSNSRDMVFPGVTENSSSDGNLEKTTDISDGFGSATSQNVVVGNSSCEGFRWYRGHHALNLKLETGHCKVFMESDDVGHSLDLSVFASYEKNYMEG